MIDADSSLQEIKSTKHFHPFSSKCKMSFFAFSGIRADEAKFFKGVFTINATLAQCFSIDSWSFRAFVLSFSATFPVSWWCSPFMHMVNALGKLLRHCFTMWVRSGVMVISLSKFALTQSNYRTMMTQLLNLLLQGLIIEQLSEGNLWFCQNKITWL